jgi:hypothetical protein
MTQEDFYQAIFEATGREFGIGYGFRAGEHLPQVTGQDILGLTGEAFVVWKDEPGDGHETVFVAQDSETSVANIISFLNGS